MLFELDAPGPLGTDDLVTYDLRPTTRRETIDE